MKKKQPAKKVRRFKCPCCFYKAIAGREWPEGWGVQTVMGLTDPKGKVIYLSDGLCAEDAMDTLIHEFVHLEGEEEHGDEFFKRYNTLCRSTKAKRAYWDACNE